MKKIDTELGEDPYDYLFEVDNHPDENDVITNPEIDDDNKDPPCVEDNDDMINTRVPLQRGENIEEGIVRSRKRDSEGMLVGTANHNPILDSREYEVQFSDESYSDYTTNVLNKNLHTQVDDHGRTEVKMKGISNHRTNDIAISNSNGWVTILSRAKKRIITIKCWEVLVNFKDGTSAWLPLSYGKESNPIELAEYAMSRYIQTEPAFAWWVTHTLKERTRIINKLRVRAYKINMKFGVLIPSDTKEESKLNIDNKNDYWDKAILKELKHVKVAF